MSLIKALEKVQEEREQVAMQVSNNQTTGDVRLKLEMRLNDLWREERSLESQIEWKRKHYNTTTSDFNRWNLEVLSVEELITYAKVLIQDAAEKEGIMNSRGHYNDSYNFADATQNVSAIIAHMNERGILESSFKFGVGTQGFDFWNAKNIKGLLNLI